MIVYFRRGFVRKLVSKSRCIGARKIKTVSKNKSKDFLYEGSILGPLFSNIINCLAIRKINKKIMLAKCIPKKTLTSRRMCL